MRTSVDYLTISQGQRIKLDSDVLHDIQNLSDTQIVEKYKYSQMDPILLHEINRRGISHQISHKGIFNG